MVDNMKVTALIPDPLVAEVSRYAHGKNLTESLMIALREWIALKKISRLNKKVASNPLKFVENFSAFKVRSLSRSR